MKNYNTLAPKIKEILVWPLQIFKNAQIRVYYVNMDFFNGVGINLLKLHSCPYHFKNCILAPTLLKITKMTLKLGFGVMVRTHHWGPPNGVHKLS